jgi:integrase/recombinase XerD
MVHNMNMLFFLYKSKTNSKGTAPIFCRLTLEAKRKQFSTGFYVNEQSWNSQFQKVKGSSNDAQHINNNLNIIRQKINKAYEDLLKDRDYIVVDELYNRYTGSDKEYNTLLQVFNYHNQKMEALIGKDYVQATYDKFVVIQSHVRDFILEQYKTHDYPLCQIKLSFLTDLDHYLKIYKGHNQNTINKVIERVKKVIKIGVGNGWLSSDPFMLYKKKKFVKEVVFLNSIELKKLEEHRFSQDRLSEVRDCFIFSCYTGLAYNEAALLNAKHLQLDESGILWIDTIRQKTQRPILVPVLPKALTLLKKHGYPETDGLLLPIISNQKINSYLKEIADVVGITKHLTHHVARKTFASTILLSNDIPIEIVSFLLGHSKTTTTELHYAKVVKETVVRHINKLNKKIR